nr:MAG TPA: hypothetical protein [Caudoviricetes sp.]
MLVRFFPYPPPCFVYFENQKATQRVTVCGKWVPPPPEPYIALLYLCPTS